MVDAENKQPPLVAGGNSSQWTFNWWGLAAVVTIASIAFVTWSWLDGSGNEPSDQLSVSTSAPTVSAETTVPTTRPSATTVPTTPPTTEPSTTTTAAPERRVLISGEMKPCRYGANCLVASFSIDGFDEHPGRFICIYPNSQRDFTFNDDEVEEACLTADDGDTITIEVDGLRSATISEQDLDGT
ncbi:MAG: hypothetical protein WKF60_03720 [Ilumatobacter sp.]